MTSGSDDHFTRVYVEFVEKLVLATTTTTTTMTNKLQLFITDKPDQPHQYYFCLVNG